MTARTKDHPPQVMVPFRWPWCRQDILATIGSIFTLGPGWPASFVVAVTDHEDEGQWPWSSTDEMMVSMFNRTRDVSFAITELVQKNYATGELLAGAIDPSKIAMSGHSLGGYATYALTGGDDEVCDALWAPNFCGDSLPEPQYTCVPSPPDPRIRAIVVLDGASQAMRYDEMARISVPSLIMGETVEHTMSYNPFPPDPDNGRWNARTHAAINRSDSHRIDVTIADHMSFAIWCDLYTVMGRLGVANYGQYVNTSGYPCVVQGTFDPKNNPVTRQIVTTYMLAFLNTYFGREDDSWMLTSNFAGQYQPNVEFFDSEACNECQVGQGDYAYRPHPRQCSVAQQDPPGYFAPLAPDGGAP